MASKKIAFVDVETTGTDPRIHELWEIGIILRTGDGQEKYAWFVRPEHMGTADPTALRIGGYYERAAEHLPEHDPWNAVQTLPPVTDKPSPACSAQAVARRVAKLLDGAKIVAANPAFDTAFLQAFLRANGELGCWSYRTDNIESMVRGWLAACDMGAAAEDLNGLHDAARAVDVEPTLFATHTAIGGAELVAEIYDRVMGR